MKKVKKVKRVKKAKFINYIDLAYANCLNFRKFIFNYIFCL